MKKSYPNRAIVFSDSEEEMEPRPSARQNLTIEEYQYEMEVTQFYRRMLAENLRSGVANNKDRSLHDNKSFAKQVSSKSVQTDPDMSSIPPSWLISVQVLVDQLHAGLGNLINSAYHQSSLWKYLKQEDGFWQSTLLPNVRIPVPRDFKGGKQFMLEDQRQSLNALLGLTRKLQIMIPEPMGDAYKSEMFAYTEKRCKCMTEDCVSEPKQAKEHISDGYKVVTTSTNASRGKVLEANNHPEDLKNHRNTQGLKICSSFSQKAAANGKKAAISNNSEICNQRASSRKQCKTERFQGENNILLEVRALKPDNRSNCREQIEPASQDITSRQQTKGQKMQVKFHLKHRSKSDLSKNGSVTGGTASAIPESLAAGYKKKIPGDVLADCSNIRLRSVSDVGNGISVKDIKNKLRVIKEKDENRPANFIERNILAVKAPVVQPGTSRSSVRRAVSKFSKPVKRN